MLFGNPDSGFLVLLMVLSPCGAGDAMCATRERRDRGRRVRSRVCCWVDLDGAVGTCWLDIVGLHIVKRLPRGHGLVVGVFAIQDAIIRYISDHFGLLIRESEGYNRKQ